jgi:Mg2+/Co2+ transporter CorB
MACLGAEAFFSGAEIALYSANKAKVRQSADQGSRTARLVLQVLDKPEQTLGSTLVIHNLAVVTGTSLATAVLVDWFDDRTGSPLYRAAVGGKKPFRYQERARVVGTPDRSQQRSGDT